MKIKNVPWITSLVKKKTTEGILPLFSSLRAYKPNSVSALLRTIAIYLPTALRRRSSGTSSFSGETDDTALHPGKDFAVSLSRCRELHPDGDDISTVADGASAFRLGRHCSHLCPCGRRALPATLLFMRSKPYEGVFGLSSI
jgi:hypothetical protein